MEWMDRWMIQDHTVKDRQSLDCGQPGTAPRATNVCQCSQPPRSAIVWGRSTWRSTQTHTYSHTRTRFSHSLQSLLLCCSVPASLAATATQTILPMREQLPQEGRQQRDLNAPKASGQSGLVLITAAMSFWTGNALKYKSWRTTWWYCVTTKNCSN